MNKIDWSKGFYGVDGIFRSKMTIEKWYLNELLYNSKSIWDNVLPRITARLLDIDSDKYGTFAKIIINCICSFLPKILIAKPGTLLYISELYKDALIILDSELKELYNDVKTKDAKKTIKDFNKEIEKAFDYDLYRKELLPQLAEYLNIKCCPYCNLHYTLLTYEEMEDEEKEKITSFQFDHFFDKSSYPLLSMSLYNLVPSCANCNHSKRNDHLTLNSHPYMSDICENFRFDIAEGKLGLLMLENNVDILKVKLVASDENIEKEVETYDTIFHISANYSRHPDIIEEINTRIYLEDYYKEEDNFKFISSLNGKLIPKDVLERIYFGNYPEVHNISKRPMAKFMQDIYHSLKQNLNFDK